MTDPGMEVWLPAELVTLFSLIRRSAEAEGKFVSEELMELSQLTELRPELKPLELEVLLPKPRC